MPTPAPLKRARIGLVKNLFSNNINNNRQKTEYADLGAQYVFQPVSVKNLGSFSSSTLDLLRDLGRRISHISGDDREVLFVFQRISVTIQRFNSVTNPSQSYTIR